MADARPFEILPAIDLRGNRVVRLQQGDFERETAYGQDPVEVAVAFSTAGARWIHVVDLDGARSGQPAQGATVKMVTGAVGDATRIEVAGGLRTADAVGEVLRAGAARAVLGTAALADPSLVTSLVAAHGSDRIVIAIDVRDGRAIGHGWTAGAASLDAVVAIEDLAAAGATTFEVTSIERDGLLGGPDLGLYERLVQLGCGDIIASGGIATLDDLRDLRARGCVGAILGRSLYEGTIDLAVAIAFGQGPTEATR
jgi:phosphoribosylformimino-5-aminoimidazole carboxamide ribotide isomerase